MRARLVPLDDAPPIDLVKDLTLVGRNEDCDVRLDDKSVSKLHCLLVKTDGLILVRDLGSTNGTRVNGQRVRRAALLPNDNISIAAYRYRVKLGDEPDPPTGTPSPDDGPTVDKPAQDSDDRIPLLDPRPGPVIRRNALPDVYPGTPASK